MLVLATAGHVDHGKSTLVRALTGMEPDRWAEERRRGMTIDLGYAWVGDITFVDVPGHERFVGNMLAGVGPVPASLLVVAADDGWSAQTEEHWQALEMLGVSHGVVAVTRSDLAAPSAAADEAHRRTGWPTVPVSAVTGMGLSALRAELSALHDRIGAAPDEGRPRLWVDRAFSLPGAGPVVTGTLAGGSLARGERVVIAGMAARITGIQSRGEERDTALPGTRFALRLRGVRREDLRRGQAVVRPGEWTDVRIVDVAVTSMRPLPRRAVLHVGSAALPAQVRGLGEGFARVTASGPAPLAPGDRGLLRDPGGAGLLTGVVVADVEPAPLPSRRGAAAERAAALAGGPVAVPPEEAGTARARPRPQRVAAPELDEAEARLRGLATFTLAEARDTLGTSRREALAILEALDSRALTVRRADGRRAWVR